MFCGTANVQTSYLSRNFQLGLGILFDLCALTAWPSLSQRTDPYRPAIVADDSDPTNSHSLCAKPGAPRVSLEKKICWQRRILSMIFISRTVMLDYIGMRVAWNRFIQVRQSSLSCGKVNGPATLSKPSIHFKCSQMLRQEAPVEPTITPTQWFRSGRLA